MRRAVLFLLVLMTAGPATAQTLIVNPQVALQSITSRTARAFFYMRLREWPDGTPVRVFVLPDQHPLHAQLAKRVLGVFPHQLRRAWDRAVFAGMAQAPESVDNVAEMRARVAETPGAIGYLPEDSIDETVRPLRIEP